MAFARTPSAPTALDTCRRARNGYQTGTKTSKSDLTQPDRTSRIPANPQVPDTPEATHNPKVAGSNPAPAIPADQELGPQKALETPADRDLKGHRKVAFVVGRCKQKCKHGSSHESGRSTTACGRLCIDVRQPTFNNRSRGRPEERPFIAVAEESQRAGAATRRCEGRGGRRFHDRPRRSPINSLQPHGFRGKSTSADRSADSRVSGRLCHGFVLPGRRGTGVGGQPCDLHQAGQAS